MQYVDDDDDSDSKDHQDNEAEARPSVILRMEASQVVLGQDNENDEDDDEKKAKEKAMPKPKTHQAKRLLQPAAHTTTDGLSQQDAALKQQARAAAGAGAIRVGAGAARSSVIARRDQAANFVLNNVSEEFGLIEEDDDDKTEEKARAAGFDDEQTFATTASSQNAVYNDEEDSMAMAKGDEDIKSKAANTSSFQRPGAVAVGSQNAQELARYQKELHESSNNAATTTASARRPGAVGREKPEARKSSLDRGMREQLKAMQFSAASTNAAPTAGRNRGGGDNNQEPSIQPALTASARNRDSLSSSSHHRGSTTTRSVSINNNTAEGSTEGPSLESRLQAKLNRESGVALGRTSSHRSGMASTGSNRSLPTGTTNNTNQMRLPSRRRMMDENSNSGLPLSDRQLKASILRGGSGRALAEESAVAGVSVGMGVMDKGISEDQHEESNAEMVNLDARTTSTATVPEEEEEDPSTRDTVAAVAGDGDEEQPPPPADEEEQIPMTADVTYASETVSDKTGMSSSRKKWMWIGIAVALVVIGAVVGIVVGVTAGGGSSGGSGNNPAPTTSPTIPPTLAPTQDAAEAAKTAIVRTHVSPLVSPQSLLNDPESPQSLAVEWIVMFDTFNPPKAIMTTEEVETMQIRFVLLVFYFALGRQYIQNASFGSQSQCEWTFVACNGNGQIQSIVAEESSLTGFFPRELQYLTTLQSLDLSMNAIQGVLSTELHPLTLLTNLDLDGNRLSGSIHTILSGMTQLTSIRMNANSFGGSIPPEIGDFSMLKALDLSFNQVGGRIPSEIGKLQNLQVLNLFTNMLEAPILPTEIGNLGDQLLELFVGSNNPFDLWQLPSEIGRLQNLLEFESGTNTLSGIIPSEIGNMVSLKRLDLKANFLSGGGLPTVIGKLVDLEDLLLNNCGNLGGIVPLELENLTSLVQLRLDDAGLSGVIPTPVCSFVNLTVLEVDDGISCSCSLCQ